MSRQSKAASGCPQERCSRAESVREGPIAIQSVGTVKCRSSVLASCHDISELCVCKHRSQASRISRDRPAVPLTNAIILLLTDACAGGFYCIIDTCTVRRGRPFPVRGGHNAMTYGYHRKIFLDHPIKKAKRECKYQSEWRNSGV